ncbi:MAG: site-2 protease family protein [Sandaracinaceae bacterium]|nr:site-2 protease family protein [Sandaracinaceae bacterium]
MDALTILVSIVGLSVMVIVHETGHYLAARAFGMRVLRYSIGFGPTLFKWQPKGSDTIFQVAAIPFLAYVQIAGMNPYEENDPDDEGLFNKKSVLGRIVTIAAGPVANYILAVLIFFGLLVSYNMPDQSPSVPPQAGTVLEPSPAHESGLLPGDVFISVAGQPVGTFDDVVAATRTRGGVATDYVIERAGERMTLTITPRAEGDTARIGVGSAATEGLRGASPAEALEEAMLIPWERTKGTLIGMATMFQDRSTEGVGGPVAIAGMLAEAADKGWQHFVGLIGLISIALGVFNLLPFPALDGGRLVFLGFEVITRRKPNERFETAVHVIGILFLLSVMVLVTYRDIFGG